MSGIEKNRDGDNYGKEVGSLFSVLWNYQRVIGNSLKYQQKIWLGKSRFEVDIKTVPEGEKQLYLPLEPLSFELELSEKSDEFINPAHFSDEDKQTVFAVDALISDICQNAVGEHQLLSYTVSAQKIQISIAFFDSLKRPLTMVVSDVPDDEFTKLTKTNHQLVEQINFICLKQSAKRNTVYAQILDELINQV